MNPLLNLEALDWKELLLDMLTDIPRYMHTNVLEVTAYRIELRKEFNKNFVKLKFSLDLLKGTPQQFWENVTVPFCSSSTELVRRHKILLDLVKQKDEEIAEYKAEGAKLIRSAFLARLSCALLIFRIKNYYLHLAEYIATKPFTEELFHTDAAGSAATDFVKTFQSVLHFYNEINSLKSHAKLDSEISSNGARYSVTYYKGYMKYLLHLFIHFSDTNESKIDGNVLPDLKETRKESVQESVLRQDKLDNDEQMHLKVEECEAGSSSNKAPILRINSTSHMIYKLKKNKKTLNII